MRYGLLVGPPVGPAGFSNPRGSFRCGISERNTTTREPGNMKCLRSWMLSVIIFELVQIRGGDMYNTETVPDKRNLNSLTGTRLNYERDDFNKGLSNYSAWSAWGKCREGVKTRRKHCLRSDVCGGHVRLEVASCQRSRDGRNDSNETFLRTHKTDLARLKTSGNPEFHVVTPIQNRLLERAQENSKRSRGFSTWSGWSPCTRRCTTTRRRYCRKPQLCGRNVIKQSAYCYLDDSYCQRWIRDKLQWKKGPDIAEKTSGISAALTESRRQMFPTCGILGRQRRRQRFHNMLRIIGGRPAPPGKWPWQVAVLNSFGEAFCGGTLVSLRWVVTAAHCVRRRLLVRLGEHDLLVHGRNELELRVVEALVHPRYDPDTVVNDVAMLRLPQPARPELGHGVACLPSPQQKLPPHTTCVILGWGKKRTTDTHGTRILHEAQVSTVAQSVCRRSYWQYAITKDMVCAGRGHRDSCAGDSGGPLLCKYNSRYYLQGVTSFGDGCGKRGKFGIYTRTVGYVSWMREVMAKP